MEIRRLLGEACVLVILRLGANICAAAGFHSLGQALR